MFNVPEDCAYLSNAPWEQLPDDVCEVCGGTEWEEVGGEFICTTCGGDRDWNI